MASVLWHLLFDPSLRSSSVLSLHISYLPLPSEPRGLLVTIALYCVELLEEAIQGLLVGAHCHVVWEDHERGMIKVEK